jgi:hypothetical protein
MEQSRIGKSARLAVVINDWVRWVQPASRVMSAMRWTACRSRCDGLVGSSAAAAAAMRSSEDGRTSSRVKRVLCLDLRPPGRAGATARCARMTSPDDAASRYLRKLVKKKSGQV